MAIGRGRRETLDAARLENFATLPFPAAVRAAVLRVAEGAQAIAAASSASSISAWARYSPQALLRRLPQISRQPARASALIGSHGQTVYHQGAPSRLLGARVASTLQIGEPAVIAALTGITTVGDFRPADMAVGGQGAPLVPSVDYLLYRDPRLRPRRAQHRRHRQRHRDSAAPRKPRDVFAFDTGPGNMVMDALGAPFHARPPRL